MQNIDDFDINIEKKDVGVGKLLIVSTPIGNKSDYTIRAVNALKIVDYVVCEERKEGARILRELNISKELILLNEQNENEQAEEVIKLVQLGNKVALVSDCGTPVFADPGAYLVRRVIELELPIEIIPGVSSIMTALVRSGLDIGTFYFGGFLSRKPEERRSELTLLSKMPSTIVLLETPYRLLPLLQTAADVMPYRQAYLAFNLTTIFESHHYGTFKQLYDKFNEKKVKAEFVLCFEGSKGGAFPFEQSYEVKPKPIRKSAGKDLKSKYSDDKREFRRPRMFEKKKDTWKPRGDDRNDNKKSWNDDKPAPRRSWNDDKPAPRRNWDDDKPTPRRSWDDDKPAPRRSWDDDKPTPRRSWDDNKPAPRRTWDDDKPRARRPQSDNKTSFRKSGGNRHNEDNRRRRY